MNIIITLCVGVGVGVGVGVALIVCISCLIPRLCVGRGKTSE